MRRTASSQATASAGLTRRSVLQGAAVAAASGGGILPSHFALAASGRVPVTFGFQWLASGAYAGYYYARAHGYYAQYDLDVTFRHVLGDALALQMPVAGKAQLIHADYVQMLELDGKEPKLHLLAVGVVAQELGLSLFYLKGNGISTPKDLEGRTIVDSPGSTTRFLFKAFARANGIDPSKVHWKWASGAAKVAVMLEGEADAVAIYLNSRPSILARLKPGQQLGVFTFGSMGADIYGDGIITTERYLKDDRRHATEFVGATMKGYLAAFADPVAGVAPICKAFPEMDCDLAVKELRIMQEQAIGPAQVKHGMGYIDPAKMQRTYDAVEHLLGQNISRPVDECYANLI